MNIQTSIDFDGPAYEREKDQVRLSGQVNAVLIELKYWKGRDRWLTVSEIQHECHRQTLKKYPEASISAQIRNLRKDRFGGWNIEGRYRAGTRVFEYMIKGE